MPKIKEVINIMKTKEEILDLLSNATCTGSYHKFSSISGFPLVTDGVFSLAQAADCHWLLDLIGSYQTNKKLDKEFQVWKLTVNTNDHNAIVQAYNDTTLIITQEIPLTDFPLEEIKLFLMGGILLLPSEY